MANTQTNPSNAQRFTRGDAVIVTVNNHLVEGTFRRYTPEGRVVVRLSNIVGHEDALRIGSDGLFESDPNLVDYWDQSKTALRSIMRKRYLDRQENGEELTPYQQGQLDGSFMCAAAAITTQLRQDKDKGGRRRRMGHYKQYAREYLGLKRLSQNVWDRVIAAGKQHKWFYVDSTTLSYPILVLEKGEAKDAFADQDRLVPAPGPVEDADDEDTSDDPTVVASHPAIASWGIMVRYDDPQHRSAFRGMHLYLDAWVNFDEMDQLERLAIKDGATIVNTVRREYEAGRMGVDRMVVRDEDGGAK